MAFGGGARRSLSVVADMDTKGLKTGAAEAEASMGRLGGAGSKMSGLLQAGMVSGIAAGGAALAAFGKASLDAASDGIQASRNLEKTFGPELAAKIDETSKKAAESFGMPAREFKQQAATMGTQLQALGFSAKDSADQIEPVTARLTDLAAKTGGDATDAMEAFSALLRGERDPIEKYGVSLKQADIDARVAANGMGGLTGEALKQAQAQASLQLFMENTTSATGSFAESQNTLDGRMQVVSARFEDVKEKVGLFIQQGLVAAWDWISANLPKWIEAFNNFKDRLVAAFTAAWNLVKPFFDGMGQYVTGLVQVLQGLWQFISGVFTGHWGRAWDGIKQIFSGAWNAMKGYMQMVWTAIQAIWNGITAAASRIFNGLKATVLGIFRGMWDGVKGLFNGATTFITAPFRAAVDAFKGLWNRTVGGFGFTIPSWVPVVGGKEFKIPKLAAGGIVTSPTLALVGEAGPEAVVPLDRYRGGGQSIVVNVTAGVGDPVAIGREVARVMEQYGRYA